ADSASDNHTVVDFSGIHHAAGNFVVRVIADLVAVRYHLPCIPVGSLVVADPAIPVPILLAKQPQRAPGGKQYRVQVVAPRNALVHPQGALMVLIFRFPGGHGSKILGLRFERHELRGARWPGTGGAAFQAAMPAFERACLLSAGAKHVDWK